MKRISRKFFTLFTVMFIVAACCLFTSYHASANTDAMITPTNKLPNGSFELDTPLPSLGASDADRTMVRSNAYARRGDYSLKLSRTNPNAFDIYYSVSVEAGKTYRFGAWVRFDPTASTTETLSFLTRLHDGAWKSEVKSPTLTPTSDFTYVCSIYTATDSKTVKLYLVMEAKNGTIGYVDDMTFEEVIPVPAVSGNMITNPSFENSAINYKVINDAKPDFVDAYTPEYVNQGQYALKVTQANAGSSIYFQVPVTPGETYKFGVSARLDKAETKATTVYINPMSLGESLSHTPSITGSDGYQNVSKIFTVPAGTNSVNMQVKASTDGTETSDNYVYYLDDVYMIKYGVEYQNVELFKKSTDKYESAGYDDQSVGERLFTVSNIKNTTDQKVNMTAIIALYSGEELIAVGTDSAAIPSGGTCEKLDAVIQVPSNVEQFELKAFIWNKNILKPYTKVFKAQ